jgi:branched-chain amino acid transport system ATP-binding protein
MTGPAALTPAIETVALSRSFGGVQAVDGASLRVPAGQRRAIIGPNGAGKTTLFNCLTGVLRPTSGRILLFGDDVTRMPDYRRARLGVGRTYQITNVFLGLTVLENVVLAVHGTRPSKWMVHRSVDRLDDTREHALAELDKVGLAHRRDVVVRALSYGERRQLELALAMASRPRVLLLDEPTAGLAPAERQRVSELIAGIPRDVTVILIEHDMSVVMGLADEVTVLHRGKVMLDGAPEVIQGHAQVREVYLGRR